MHIKWKIVPISESQRQDVRPEDLLQGGLYRACNTYRGGGGYDQFHIRVKELFKNDTADLSRQFIAQLYGCNLACPYCYVTHEGIWGKPKVKTSEALVGDYLKFKDTHNLPVFHLMGGAPALQLNKWWDLVRTLEARSPATIFHSDLMLCESLYSIEVLKELVKIPLPQLYAVNIKGLTKQEFRSNTGKEFDESLMLRNFNRLEYSGLNFYITFTAVNKYNADRFWNWYRRFHPTTYKKRRAESFHINLVDYKAINWYHSQEIK